MTAPAKPEPARRPPRGPCATRPAALARQGPPPGGTARRRGRSHRRRLRARGRPPAARRRRRRHAVARAPELWPQWLDARRVPPARPVRATWTRSWRTGRRHCRPQSRARSSRSRSARPTCAAAREVVAEHKRINALPDGPDKEQAAARRSMSRATGSPTRRARRELLRAIYSPAQLREQMVWFWLNHFSVYQYKANLRWLVADYERAGDPSARARPFPRPACMATLEHPAMLQYLDNAQNAAGHINENYARELMELHTLGVDGGYTQQDVQAAGAGSDRRRRQRQRHRAASCKPELQRLLPARRARSSSTRRATTSADKRLLGQTHRRAAASPRSSRRSTCWSASRPARASSRASSRSISSPTIRRARWSSAMAQTFQATDGDIAAVLRTMLYVAGVRRRAGTQVQGPDAVRRVGRAPRLRRADRSTTRTR